MNKQSILIIDDEKIIRRSMEVALKKEGFEVNSAKNAELALTAIEGGSYDLIFTDYIMDGITGGDLIKQVKTSSPQSKVIVFSGCADPNSVDEILAMGADDFLPKPINLDVLLERISNALDS